MTPQRTPSRPPGSPSRTATSRSSAASTSPSRPAPSTPCSGPTAPARPPWSASSPPSSAPTAATAAGRRVTTSPPHPDGVRRSIGVTGQFSAIDELLTGRENLRLMADLAHLPAPRRGGPGRRAAGAVRPRRRRRPARRDVLRRHEAPARPRDDPGQPAADDLPRRADAPGSTRAAAASCGRSCATLLADGVTVFLTTQYLEEADQLAAHRRACSTAAAWSPPGRPPSSRPRPEARRSTTSSSPSPGIRQHRRQRRHRDGREAAR